MPRRRISIALVLFALAASACSNNDEIRSLETRLAVLEATDPASTSDGLVAALENQIGSLEQTNSELLALVAALATQDHGPVVGEPFELAPDYGFGVAPDGSGAAPQIDPPPDFSAAIAADDGTTELLGVVNDLPREDYLYFLFEFCEADSCFRDAHFMDPTDSRFGSGPWAAGRPFHIRHGFINEGAEALGAGFDVVVYVTRWGDGGPAPDAFVDGVTYRFTADYVLRDLSDRCGPTYRTQSGPATCEWFVHDFPEGLPQGRYDLWVTWEAPCSYWQEISFADDCADANEVMSLFSAGVNSPFDPGYFPEFNEENQAPSP